MKKFLITLSFLFLGVLSDAQEFTPVVTQFNKRDYKADNQNWSVTYGDDGLVYFGNGSCLLSYDGIIWSKYHMPYNKIVRSVMAGGNRIYVGSYEEFGYFEKMDDGRLVYRSLSDLLTGYEMQNDEIWTILQYGDKVVFQSFTSYFVYDGENVTAYRASTVFQFFCLFGDTIYTDTNTEGLCTIDLETSELTKVDNPFSSPLVAILDKGDGSAYFVTYSNGIHVFDGKGFRRFRTEADEGLETWQVNHAELSIDGNIIIGTLLNGAVAIDGDGEVKWQVNTSNILQSNTILGMDCDRNGNLWFALDTGIALIPSGNSMMYINSLYPGVGAVYTAYYDDPYLYMGTGQGLYRARMNADFREVSDIEIIPDIKGHVWDISEFDSQVFISTNTETYELLQDGTFKAVSPVSGGMCMAKGKIAGRDVLVQGTYTYLCIYVRENGKWKFSHAIEDFMDPISTIAIDYTGTIWAGHLHHGLYGIELSPDLKHIAGKDYYDSLGEGLFLPIRVYTVNERIAFADTKNMYTYDELDKRIVPYDELNSTIFKDAYRICRSGYGSYWFITGSEAAKLNFKSGGEGVEISDIVAFDLFGSHTVDMNQNIIPIGDGVDLFTLENSIALYPSSEEIHEAATDLFVKEFKISDMTESSDSLMTFGAGKVKIPYKYRNIDVTLSCPYYAPVNGVSFSHILKGFDEVWNNSNSFPFIRYRHLSPGKYVLKVKAVTESGRISDELSYEFQIMKPFYLSAAALIVYALLLAAVVYFVIATFNDKTVKNRLEEEVKDKSKELASSTLTLIQKNESLIQIRKEIEKVKKKYETEYPDLNLAPVIKLVDSHLSSDSDWELFRNNFDRIHENFFRNLKIRYPDLTETDLRFCAYLRLNLSSKDIASLMNISLKGVEAARYRIRKKINLPSENSLTGFLIGFKE